MQQLEKILSGGDLRSIGQSNAVAAQVKTQGDFDALFALLFHTERLVVMRAADAIEKITIDKPAYLAKHAEEVLILCKATINKELTWHLAQLLPRLQMNGATAVQAWQILKSWAVDKTNSRIVRVNALQGLFTLAQNQPALKQELDSIASELEKEGTPSIIARIRKLRQG